MSERDPISGSSRGDYGATAAPPTVGFADFSPTELYDLSESIADNINTINSGLRTLEKMMKQIGGSNDSLQLRDKIHDTQQTVNGSVSATARDIQRLGVVVRRGDKPQKLQVERLTQAFKDALAKYSSVQKQVTEKMAAHMPRQARVRNDPQALEQQAMADDEEASLLANQQAQARLVQFETSMVREREAYMHKIEADVLDITQIMQELAEMVNTCSVCDLYTDRYTSCLVHAGSGVVSHVPAESDNGRLLAYWRGNKPTQHRGNRSVTNGDESKDTVESHIETAGASVEAGVDELAKAAEHQRRYRRKMFILILIAIILSIIFVVWIVKAFR